MPSVLSIFADESGEWGKRSEYYLITLVFHDQSKDISLALERYRQSLADYGLPDVPFHAGPLLTGHDAYEGMSLSERKRLLGLFVIMTRRLPITYRTLCIVKVILTITANVLKRNSNAILLIYFWRIFRISILMALSRCITTVANR